MQGIWELLAQWRRPERPKQSFSIVAPDDLILTQTKDIDRVLNELIDSSRRVAVHSIGDRYTGFAVLRTYENTGLCLSIKPTSAQRLNLHDCNINITTATGQGSVFFTLQTSEINGDGTIQAARPKEIIRVQSRDQYRLIVPHGSLHRATLRIPGQSRVLPIHNVSEHGLGLRFDCPTLQGMETILSSTLELDEHALLLPTLRIVHNGPVGRYRWHIGAQIVGMSKSDCRVLTRWINEVETTKMAVNTD